jgi:ubiquitin-conjugating enzyme E2 D/E
MFSSNSKILEELNKMRRNPPVGCSASLKDPSNIYEWKASIIGPKDSPYVGGVFKLSIKLPTDYPSSAPTIKFVTPIYHPNVHTDGSICVDLLSKWREQSHTIPELLAGIVVLLATPGFKSPYSHVSKDLNEYKKIAQEWTTKHAK